MLPSLTVPNRVATPRNELRVDQNAFVPPEEKTVASGLSKLSAVSICHMNLRPYAPMLRSPRKPRYEFCTSTTLRGPGVETALPVITPVVEASVDTPVPGCDASLLVPNPNCG